MAASFLLSDCLEIIFSNLLKEIPNSYTYVSTKEIYSCTLVSRYWCKISTPLLYAYPFHHLVYSNSYRNCYYECYFKLIRTLLSCIPKSEIKQIKISNTSNIQKLLSNITFLNKESSYSNILTSYNYITFIRGIIFHKVLLNLDSNKVIRNQKLWLPPYILNNLKDYQLSRISIPIMKYFVEYLCKHCYNLTTLNFPFVMPNNYLSNNIIKLLTFNDNNGINKLTNLKELKFINNENGSKKKSKNLYLALSNSTCNLSLLYNEGIGTIREANLLSQFISLQKNLQHIILSESKSNSFFGYNKYYNIVFNSLSTQSESLQTLELKRLTLNKINEEALNSLCSLKNIKELKLCSCREINDDLNSWANNLTKLEVLEFDDYYISPKSEDFLIQLIRSSSNTLTKLTLNYNISKDDDQLTQQIPFYLHSLIHLELPKVFPDILISIFESCTKLIYLSTILSDDESWDNILRDLGRLIPKNLRKIRFGKMMFSSIELKFFLEECVNSNGKLKYIEITNRNINDEYFNVAKEFDVKLIKVKPGR
ncbi:hypothetical protein RclHR1_00030051 [Rhizophagus clarus]|uniref:F-box domain-containing protein n=1 Tax=Rhizophagus clarus TaxID=94130 RepID=A0A2Z6RHF2_9GLOM|nr:hypothetical protein RclHR1_00030051 [Rhizophagus clarus]GES95560.1 hypothetical protein GLOIN_2v1769487 [Rhizophagus clarus]